jgi:hypothetical protein
MALRKLVTFDLGDIEEVLEGDPVDISNVDDVGVLVEITDTATASVELSFDGGTTWVAHPDFDGITASKSGPLGMRAQQMRLNVTAHTGGSVNGRAAGSGPGIA